MFASYSYASPSAFNNTAKGAGLHLATNSLRDPVHFCGTVVPEYAFTLRTALRALGEAIWSEDAWESQEDMLARVLDPVITVHPDRLWFEAFNQDMSAYLALIVEPEVFRAEGATTTGTTNIDFTAWLWGALGELRSSRQTRVQVGAQGFSVNTENAGGRFEEKVDLPDAWVQAFLQTQAAMSHPGTRLSLRPVDLLAAIRFLAENKSKVSPRALRFELPPGEDARLLIEPWDHVVPLVGASHSYTELRSIRTWGRRRLKLLEPLLPFAERVDVYLKGRALPSFYAVKLPGMTFILGLAGFANQGFAGSGLALAAPTASREHLAAVQATLAQAYHLSTSEVAARCGLSTAAASAALNSLTQCGRVMFDVEAKRWRHRELFTPPVQPDQIATPDERPEQAAALLQAGVTVSSAMAETETTRRSYRDPRTGAPIMRDTVYRQWRVRGETGSYTPEIVVNAEERIIYGECSCAYFKEQLFNQGPCSHMLALFHASLALRGSQEMTAIDTEAKDA